MIEFGGTIYSLDLDVLETVISPEPKADDRVEIHKKTYLDDKGNITGIEINEVFNERIREVNATKYDIIRTMIDVVLDLVDNDEIDDTLGPEIGLDKTSLPFKIAFNTLLEYGILKEK